MALRRPSSMVIGLTIFALVDGIVIGLVAGIIAQIAGASPPSIEPNEFVWLVSIDYASGGDLPKAVERLSLLQPTVRQMPALVRRAARQAESSQDLPRAALMLRLADALVGNGPVAAAAEVAAATNTPAPVVTSGARPVPGTGRSVSQAPHEPVGIGASADSTAAPTATRQPAPTATRQTAANNAATAAITPGTIFAGGGASSADFRLSLVRQLTPCENGGNHHLHILVLDRLGNGLPNIPIEIVWDGGRSVDTTGKKVEVIPSLGIDSSTTAGYLNFPMFHGSYRVRVLQSTSDQTDWLTVDIPRDEMCVRIDNPVGNSTFHYSYLIVFRQAR